MPKQSRSVKHAQQGRDEALEAYLLQHVPGLREYEAAQHKAFIYIEQDAYGPHPDLTPDDIATAEAAEAALPSRKRTEVQFAPLAAHLPSEIKRSRRRFVQRHQRAWNKAKPNTTDMGTGAKTHGRVHKDFMGRDSPGVLPKHQH